MNRILITGGASGLGAALANYYASQGWSICVADIQDNLGEEFVAQLNKQFATDSFYAHLDVTRDEDWQTLVNTIGTRWQGLDAIVNNAGVASSGDIDAQSIKDFQWTVDINLMGVVKGCHYFTPFLKKSQGHLINVASMAGLLHMPGMAAYNVSKAAVVALSETLYAELSPFKVGVSVLCPAFFKTNLTDNMRDTSGSTIQFAKKLMSQSSIQADGIAKLVFDAHHKGQYLILTHTRESMLWRLKRFLPAFYFSMMKKMAAKMQAKFKEKRAWAC